MPKKFTNEFVKKHVVMPTETPVALHSGHFDADNLACDELLQSIRSHKLIELEDCPEMITIPFLTGIRAVNLVLSTKRRIK